MAMKWNGPLSELPERLQVVIAELTKGGYLKHPDNVSVYAESIQEVLTDVWEAFSDGFDLSDLGALGGAVGELTAIAVDAESLSDEVIDEFLCDCALVIYKIWDPDIPYLWESAENKIEAMAIRAGATMAVAGIRRALQRVKDAPDDGPVGDPDGPEGDSGEDLPTD